MPSLQALEAFKNSFRKVGKEDAILAAQDIPLEDLALPGSEAASSPEPPEPTLENRGDTGALSTQAEAEAPPQPVAGRQDDTGDSSLSFEDEDDFDADFDFGDLVSPALSTAIAEEAPPPSEEEGALEEVAPELDIPPPEDISFEELEDSLKLDTPPSEEEAAPEQAPSPLDLPPPEDISFEELEDSLKLDTPPGEEEAAPEQAPSPLDLSPSEDISFEELGTSLSDKPEEDSPFTLEQDDDGSSLEGLPLDTFDAFKVETEPDSSEPEAETAHVLSPASRPLETDLTAIKPSADIEEIIVSPEELASITKTLDSYPLNLRIACEEAIAEQAVEPALMSKLIKSLVKGASAAEMVPLVGKILGRIIIIPKNFEMKTGEDLEAGTVSFTYIFVHKFLPVCRLVLIIALVMAFLCYLAYRFIYTPIRADLVYRKGYGALNAGEYSQAKERFSEALSIHPVKRWFYRYAKGFRDARQYIYAEEMYDGLLRYYPRDKKGVLDYASMETNQLYNYAKADSLLRRNILDYAADDKEGLLAVGDNALAWGDRDPQRYEDARDAYARYLERYGWVDPVVARMLKYFIRTDNLKEVLPLQSYFMDNPGRKIAPAALAELGGYLLDKKLEEARGVPNEYISYIDGIRDILVKAADADPSLPESHYHLARYYNYFDNVTDERITLERAIQTFNAATEESVRSLHMRIDTERRYARLLITQKEFFAAEEHLIRGVGLYEDGVNRQILSRSPQFGRLYADLGDLAYFTQEGNMARALEYYIQSEQNGWAPPEIQYRMGSAHYHQRQWGPGLERFFAASSDIPLNRRLLNALGNVSYMRGDYFTAQGYYSRLRDLLEADRIRFPLLLPNERPDHLELIERLMVVQNNLGVTLEALTERTGDNRYRSQALGLYTESARAWDALTRNPETAVRFGVGELSMPGLNLAFLNSLNSLHPESDYEPQIYMQIDKDVLEPSPWEELAPQNFRLSDALF
ncbi:MAG: tetratricopeptide repeat protein [Treponema sp.]|jgi:tetratricopeptide (TPR) repeat protein|nr:tetratricopeptide repeat protein [Treponema sp.]